MPKKGYKQKPKQINQRIKTRRKNNPLWFKNIEERNRKASISLMGKLSPRKGKTFIEYFGKKKAKEISEKLRDKKLEDNHPNWRGGIQFKEDDKRYNEKFKESIKERDGNKCMNCGKSDGELNFIYLNKKFQREKLQIHHIDYNKYNTIKQNCITLCKSCHMRTTWERDKWIPFFQNKLSQLYGYTY